MRTPHMSCLLLQQQQQQREKENTERIFVFLLISIQACNNQIKKVNTNGNISFQATN